MVEAAIAIAVELSVGICSPVGNLVLIAKAARPGDQRRHSYSATRYFHIRIEDIRLVEAERLGRLYVSVRIREGQRRRRSDLAAYRGHKHCLVQASRDRCIGRVDG